MLNSMRIGGTTLGMRAEALGDRSRGFDYLRITLAVAVVAWHSWGLSFGRDSIRAALETPVGFLTSSILPAFFALSGYLVTMSLFRSATLKNYVMLRVIRILPALSVEITLSALVLGPIVTTVALSAYFSDPLFYKYFLNLVGLVQYLLPGVFATNPYPSVVNGSLWTLPYELECYLYLVILTVLGAKANRSIFLIGLVIALALVLFVPMFERGSVVVFLKTLLSSAPGIDPNLQADARVVNANPANLVVVSFLAGAVMFAFRNRIPFDGRLAALSAVAILALFTTEVYHLAAIPIAYLTVWLGLANPPSTWIISKGDYSYGIYLYSFPVQQCVSLALAPEANYPLHFALSLAFSFVLAVFSWHLVEKPFQRVKKRFR